MIHHYNYTSPLSHFLGQYPGGISEGDGTQTPEEPAPDVHGKYPVAGTSATAAQGKSFTIAAILGLKDQEQNTAQDLTVVNLSVHQGVTDRLQGRLSGLPVRHLGGSGGTTVYRGSVARGPQLKKPPPHSSSKSKRVRTIFTPEQLERLEAEFERQQYMVGPERLYLAHTLQLTEAQVKVWFQNRRIKWRKHHLEVTQQRLAAIKQRQMMAVASGGEPGESADGEDTGSETDT